MLYFDSQSSAKIFNERGPRRGEENFNRRPVFIDVPVFFQVGIPADESVPAYVHHDFSVAVTVLMPEAAVETLFTGLK
jgi:hypothetical protein